MTDAASSKRNGSNAPGRPIQPGQVLNPEGRNQWTYRRDFEQTIAKLLRGELSEAETEAVPEWVQDLVSPGMTRGQALALIVVGRALRGDEKSLSETLKRIWPATEKRELAGAGGDGVALNHVVHVALAGIIGGGGGGGDGGGVLTTSPTAGADLRDASESAAAGYAIRYSGSGNATITGGAVLGTVG